jgi:hypothetical protein
MSISEKLCPLDFEIYEVSQKNLIIDGDIAITTERIISYKYTTHTSNMRFKPE